MRRAVRGVPPDRPLLFGSRRSFCLQISAAAGRPSNPPPTHTPPRGAPLPPTPPPRETPPTPGIPPLTPGIPPHTTPGIPPRRAGTGPAPPARPLKPELPRDARGCLGSPRLGSPRRGVAAPSPLCLPRPLLRCPPRDARGSGARCREARRARLSSDEPPGAGPVTGAAGSAGPPLSPSRCVLLQAQQLGARGEHP